MSTSISRKNINQPAPRWFRRVKKAISILTVAANVMVAQYPTGDEMFKMRVQLWCTVGIGAIMESLEALLANGEIYVNTQDNNK